MSALNGSILFLNDYEIELIHDNSINILSEIGFYVPNELILGLLEKNNCEVDYQSKVVKVNPNLIKKALHDIPKKFSSIPYIEGNKISFNDGNIHVALIDKDENPLLSFGEPNVLTDGNSYTTFSSWKLI